MDIRPVMDMRSVAAASVSCLLVVASLTGCATGSADSRSPGSSAARSATAQSSPDKPQGSSTAESPASDRIQPDPQRHPLSPASLTLWRQQIDQLGEPEHLKPLKTGVSASQLLNLIPGRGELLSVWETDQPAIRKLGVTRLSPERWEIEVQKKHHIELGQQPDGSFAQAWAFLPSQQSKASYEPAITMMPTTVQPGEVVEQAGKVMIRRASGRLLGRGRYRSTWQVLGRQELITPVGRFPDALVFEQQQEMDLGWVQINVRICFAQVPGVGRVMAITRKRIRALGLFNQREDQAMVLLRFEAIPQAVGAVDQVRR